MVLTDPHPLTPYDIFQYDHNLSDCEMQWIKLVYVKGKTRYKMPDNNVIEINIK